MIFTIRAGLAFGLRKLAHTRLSRITRRFARHEEGATAVEFGIVAAPFLGLMFAIMETALVFFASQTLETAVADSARLIMTGQAQQANYSEQQFKDQVCSRIKGLFDCQTKMKIDVKKYDTFGAIDNAKPIGPDGKLQTSNFGYQPGGPGQIVVVRLMYEWPVFASVLNFNLADLSGSNRLLIATAAFRNEPYQ